LFNFNTSSNTRGPEPLKINGNILSTFVVGGIGLFGGFFVFLWEKIKLISFEKLILNISKFSTKYFDLLNPKKEIITLIKRAITNIPD